MDWKEIAGAVAQVAPTLGAALGGPVGYIAGKAGQLIAQALGVDAQPEAVQAALTGDNVVKLKELEVQEQAQILEWQKAQLDAEVELEKSSSDNATARNAADMASDSWLAKNIRPLCLLVLTACIGVGLFCKEAVSAEKYEALLDLGNWVYGYYFVGRSVFDKPGRGLADVVGAYRGLPPGAKAVDTSNGLPWAKGAK